MTTNTLTRADLTEAVFQAVGLSRNESAQMVEDLLEEICSALSKGETVKLSSSQVEMQRSDCWIWLPEKYKRSSPVTQI